MIPISLNTKIPELWTFPALFDELSGDCRCWVFGAAKSLNSESEKVDATLQTLQMSWNSHGTPVEGHWKILNDYFLVVALSRPNIQMSGCSTDQMLHEIGSLQESFGRDLLESSKVFYLNSSQKVACVTRDVFKQACKSGEVTLDTIVFDLNVDQVDQIRKGLFALPLADSWHKRLYELIL